MVLVMLTVIYANTFAAKTGELYTRLFVSFGAEMFAVVARGDRTALAGTDVQFQLYCRDGQLRLGVPKSA